jgi:hypothetical protein
MKNKFHLVSVLAGAAMAISGAWCSAKADIYVLESTASGVKVGSHLASGQTIAIPAGSFVRAVLPSGKTQTIRGPYNGPVADLGRGQALNEGVMKWLRNILQTGGATEATPGATRSLGRPNKANAGFSWTVIPVTMEGAVCVEKGAALSLARAYSQRPERVTVTDTASSTRGETSWDTGSHLANWPKEVSLRSNAVYQIAVQGRAQHSITVKVLDRLPGEDEILAELERQDCRHQFETWVREKIAGAPKT